jgi:predicted DNA-binding transcriptional regulator AlpA
MINKDVEFLKAYLKKLQDDFQTLDYLCPNDIVRHPKDYTPVTRPDDERVARLADENGFNGNIFRNLLKADDEPVNIEKMQRGIYKQIKIIPKIIAAIEKPADRSAIPTNAELLTIPQLAGKLQWGESVVRERDKKGLLPMPIRIGGTIQWRKQEIEEWLAAGCPARQKWEQQKQGKVA